MSSRQTRKNKSEEYPKDLVDLGRQIARFYRRQVFKKNSYAKPWRLDVPLETLAVFANFVTVGRIVRSIKANYREYVRAQFECWNGPRWVYPVPSQLVSDGAMDRYNKWLCKNKPTITKEVISPKKREAEFEREEKQLKRMSEALKLSVDDVLVQECSEFSQAFLERKGVWSLCGTAWKEAHD